MRVAFPVVGWVVTRAATVWLFYGAEAWVTGDAGYFAESLRAVPDLGIRHVLVEYPLPAVLVVAVPWMLARGAGLTGAYPDLLMLVALATDALFGLLLGRVGRRSVAAVWVWVLGVPLLGATAYARFDLLPGVLVGVALLCVAERPRLGAAALTVATAVKLWPVLLLPGLLARSRGPARREAAAAVGVVGGALVAGSLVVGGWTRLVSPLAYQAERGLQIESWPALPAMVGWWGDPTRWHVGYAASHAYEVTGPGVGALLAASTLATVLLLAGLGGGWTIAWRLRERLSGTSVTWLTLTALSGWVCVGKVLSPQYLLWLLPTAAAALASARARDRALLAWCAGLLVAAGLTHLVFPTFYAGLLAPGPHAGRAVLVLAARNAVLLVLFVTASVQARRSLAADARRDPSPVSLSGSGRPIP